MKRTTLIFTIIFIISSIGLAILFVFGPSNNRPQEPQKPYPYYSEEVAFENSASNATLAGTLTMPRATGHYAAVILITGSGAQNRDEEIAGHKPFLIIADYLTRRGIAVLRFDDRGVGKSTGDFRAATTFDFASDVTSAIEYLKSRMEVDNRKIGLIGHSEGGIIAPLVASSSEDVSFIVLLAGPGIEVRKVLLMQQELIPRAMGVPEADVQKSLAVTEQAFEMISTSNDRVTLKTALAELIDENYDDTPASLRPQNLSREQVIATQSEMLSSPWYKILLNYDPAPTLEKVTCPVLALNGEKDIQVTPKHNLDGIRDALKKGGNENVTVKELSGLNHLFQNCTTGSPAEYETIEQTFSPVALEEMSDWILKQVK
jgi:hypothetical protein